MRQNTETKENHKGVVHFYPFTATERFKLNGRDYAIKQFRAQNNFTIPRRESQCCSHCHRDLKNNAAVDFLAIITETKSVSETQYLSPLGLPFATGSSLMVFCDEAESVTGETCKGGEARTCGSSIRRCFMLCWFESDHNEITLLLHPDMMHDQGFEPLLCLVLTPLLRPPPSALRPPPSFLSSPPSLSSYPLLSSPLPSCLNLRRSIHPSVSHLLLEVPSSLRSSRRSMECSRTFL
eukprot:755316-Hanusia_phi.AAC.3